MSVLSSDLEEALLRYVPILGEDGLHNSGRIVRAVHMLKMLKQNNQLDRTGFQLPTPEEKQKIFRLAISAAKENNNVVAYKALWVTLLSICFKI